MDGEQAAPAAEQAQETTAAATTDAATTEASTEAAPAAEQDATETPSPDFQASADMVDRGETTLERVAQHIAESFELAYDFVRAEIAKLLPDGHPEKPIANEPQLQAAADESKTAVPAAVALPTVEEAKADLDANPYRASSLSQDGHVVREI